MMRSRENCRKSWDRLWDSAFPITEDELRDTIEIEKAISSYDNILRFPEKPRVDED